MGAPWEVLGGPLRSQGRTWEALEGPWDTLFDRMSDMQIIEKTISFCYISTNEHTLEHLLGTLGRHPGHSVECSLNVLVRSVDPPGDMRIGKKHKKILRQNKCLTPFASHNSYEIHVLFMQGPGFAAKRLQNNISEHQPISR